MLMGGGFLETCPPTQPLICEPLLFLDSVIYVKRYKYMFLLIPFEEAILCYLMQVLCY